MSYVRGLGSTQSRPMSRVRVAMGDIWYAVYADDGHVRQSGVSSSTTLDTTGMNGRVVQFASRAELDAALKAAAPAPSPGFMDMIANPSEAVSGMSTGAKVAIGAGILGGLYFLARKS